MFSVRPAGPGDARAWLRLRHALWPDGSEAEHAEEIERYLAAAEDWGRSQGCTEFESDAAPDNEVSAPAHRAVGFVDVGLVRCFRKDLSAGE